MRKKFTKSQPPFLLRLGNTARLVFTLACLLLYSISGAQKIDSLKRLLPATTGRVHCDVLYQLAYEYIDVDNPVGLQYAAAALTEAGKLGDSLRFVKAGRVKALAFTRLKQLDSAIYLFNLVLPVAERNGFTDLIKSILNGMALAYTYEARYDDALRYHFRSLELREVSGDKSEIFIALLNIGFNYYKMEHYEKALSYYERAFKLKDDVKKNLNPWMIFVNMSLCYAYTDNFSKAKYYLDRLVSICADTCSELVISNVKFSAGVISFRQQKYAEAEAFFLESYALSERLNDQRILMDNIVYLSQVYIHANNLKLAEKYLTRAEKLVSAGTPYNLELINIYNMLFTLYANSGDYRKVSLYQRKYIQLKDSIFNEELTKNLMKLEAEYLERENRAKIEAQDRILALNQAVIVRQRLISAFVGLIAILLVVVAVILIRINRLKRSANRVLEEKVKERTRELELNRDTLQRSLDERSVVFHKVSTDIRSSLATIRGLCSLGLTEKEATDRNQYIRRIDLTSESLLNMLHKTFANGTSAGAPGALNH